LDEEVGEVQADRGRSDEDFTASRHRIGTLAKHETVGAAIAVHEPDSGLGGHRGQLSGEGKTVQIVTVVPSNLVRVKEKVSL